MTELFSSLTRDDILAFQFSSWYPKFSRVSIKSTIIRPLSEEFGRYLTSDGVFVPEGSEDIPVQSTLSDDEGSDDGSDDEREHFAFPDLDKQIRKAISEYGAVFPKLNFSSPKDASWVLPASSPLKCTSPADVYMLLKSSDFISHDISPDSVFLDCDPNSIPSLPYALELVLRKWYPIDTSREFRCFVRQGVLLGMSQRDSNHYEFMNDTTTLSKITQALVQLWESEIKGKWPTSDYIFDVLLTRDLTRGHIVDFNPFAPRTDSLLFSYEELLDLVLGPSSLPVVKVIDSRMHPAAIRNAPTHQHNMVPSDVLNLSDGQSIGDFARLWQDELNRTLEDD